MSMKIVVIDSGWVMVGKLTEYQGNIGLTDASVIRVWGTTRGLGQLIKGPRKDTVLDPIGTVNIPNHSVKFIIDCPEWPT